MKPLRRGVIHRLELPIDDLTDVYLPGFRKILHVANHRNHEKSRHAFEVWYERELLSEDLYRVRFRVVGTGNPIDFRTGPTYAEHLGTVTTHNGLYVWHVYVECPVDSDGDDA